MIPNALARLLRRRRRSTVIAFGVIFVITTFLFVTRIPELSADRFRQPLSPEEAIRASPPQEPLKELTSTTTTTAKPAPSEHDEDDSQKPLVPPMKYGTNARPPLKIMQTVIADLPAKHLPTYSPSAKSPKRLVIVGDVHGQLSALQSLLDKLSFSTPAGDHLILAGDMVTKGPDSVGVVDLAMRLGASAVRGNHEDRVLLVASRGSSDVVPTLANYTNTTAYGTIATADDRAKSVARALSAAQLTWLASRPIILRVGRLPSSSSPNTNTPPWNAGELFVVHAGLVPRVPLHQQDPWAVMNMRSLLYPFSDVRRKTVRKRLDARAKKEHDRLDAIAKEEHERHPELPKPPVPEQVKVDDAQIDAEIERLRALFVAESGMPADAFEAGRDVAVPIEGRDGEPWSEVWNRVQNGIERDEDRKVVVYGHDARKGLQVKWEVDVKSEDEDSSEEGENKAKREEGGEEEKEIGEEEGDVDEAGHKKKKKKKGKKTGVRYAFGLDSGCGNGKQLSALVLEAGPDGVTHRIVQVDCAEVEAAAAADDDEKGEKKKE